MMSEETIERNTRGIQRTLEALLRSSTPSSPEPVVLNNLEWFGSMSLLAFLRDAGKLARVVSKLRFHTNFYMLRCSKVCPAAYCSV